MRVISPSSRAYTWRLPFRHPPDTRIPYHCNPDSLYNQPKANRLYYFLLNPFLYWVSHGLGLFSVVGLFDVRSLTLWIDTRSTDTWLDADTPARRGRRCRYTDAAILCALQLREVYHLPLRATEGLVRSILHLMHLELPAAHYSTLSRRARSLELPLAAPQQIKHLAIDSSGLKVYGEGEWQMRTHDKSKRRTWRKLHISMDAETRQLTASSITHKDELDRNQVAGLLEQTQSEVERVCGRWGL
jgi:hypothetical protein